MPNLTITKKDLREVVTESVREALSSEFMKLRVLALPPVGPKEQQEIEKSLRRTDRIVAKRIRVSL